MKNTKTKIILSAIIFLSVAGFAGIVFAAGSSLYVSPASLTKTVGDTLSVSVGVNAAGSKVCAVEGTLVFNNLSCQSITVAGDVNPQSSPTCSKSYFLIGVPSCTTVDKVLFTVSAKTGSAGTASINFTGVDIIGEGVSVGSASISGNYTINAVPKPTSAPAPVAPKKPAVEAPAPIPSQGEEVTVPAPAPAVEQPVVQEVVIKTSPFVAAIGGILTLGTGSVWVGILVGIAVLAILIYLVYFFSKKSRSKKLV